MARKSNRGISGIIRKRDQAYARLEFNRQYPEVAAARMDGKNALALKRQELKSKKKLLPLELDALPERERNQVLIQRELDRLREKQVMPRRAIRQTYLRTLESSGEEAAAKERDAQLARLDQALEQREAQLRQKYAGTSEAPAPREAVENYQRQSKAEQERLDALAKKQAEEKEQALRKLTAKLEDKNKKLQVEFDEANRKLRSMSKIDEDIFGRDNLLHIEDLKMYFSGIKALDGISFRVRQGEIFGLIGPNGAGKTTLFNCITQFYKPTGGNIYYRDRFDNLVDLTEYLAPDVIKSGISRTFQNVELVYFLSVLDNLLVGAHANYDSTLADQFLHTKKLKNEEEVFRKRALDLLDRLGILAYKDAFPFGLPYGVLKKVELARTLMSEPRLIILDEPAAGLNDTETEELAQIIRQIRDDFHCTILLVEHDMNLVMSVCDTVCAISFGKMLAIGTPEEIQSNPQVQEAYLGTE